MASRMLLSRVRREIDGYVLGVPVDGDLHGPALGVGEVEDIGVAYGDVGLCEGVALVPRR